MQTMTTEQQSLKGKVALVTGGGRGIGRATAIELARRGADVALAARHAAEIDRVAVEIRGQGRRTLALAVDLADAQAARGLIPSVERELGPVAILVNNAGVVGPFGATWELDPDDWEGALRVNLVAPFLLARAALPGMIAAGWGRIVGVSSGAAQNPFARTGAYSTSKAGLDMLTRQIAAEAADTGVVAIAVYPGVVDTAMPANIRAQPEQVVGAATARRFRQLHDDNAFQPPERPARLIAALVAADDPTLNGRIVDIHDAEGQRFLATTTP
jgi:NAD(P)-dependent dehydrogenase (short-subunit alcohol dehydrogenase family)